MSSKHMSSTQPAVIGNGSHIQAGTRAKLLSALFTATLGLALVYAAGFSHISALHNATHDARHSAGFPCH